MHRIALVCVLIGCCALAGCEPRDGVTLHYLNGFVLGAHNIFSPAKVAVAPVGGELAAGTHTVGGIYDPSGHLQKRLRVSDTGAIIHGALMTGLADAGLKPIAVEAAVNGRELQPGVDVMLSCEVQQIKSEKNFGAEQTIHGQYFTMSSRVALKFTLRRRDGALICEKVVVGTEDEPPTPVGNEVFLPLETDPGESLSVALSRAIGALLLDPQFRAAFPPRAP